MAVKKPKLAATPTAPKAAAPKAKAAKVAAPAAVASKVSAKVSAKVAATKVAAPKVAAPKVAAPKAAANTAVKAGTPKAPVKKIMPKVAAKLPAPVKITDKQLEFLKAIHSAGENGYSGSKKAEAKSIDSLLAKKLIKKGAKNKATGVYSYTVSKAGQKHIGTPAA